MKCFGRIEITLVRFFLIVTTMLLGTTSILYAGGEIPYTFSPGNIISSDQVNKNFQALEARIAALEGQLGTVSVVGTYDYIKFETRMSVEHYTGIDTGYKWSDGSYRGTCVFDVSGNVQISGPGGFNQMEIRNTTSNQQPYLTVSGNLSTDSQSDALTTTYTLSGSTVTINIPGGFGTIVGTVSADAKVFIGNYQFPGRTGMLVAIKRQ